MDKIQARKLVKDTFENGFDKNRFYYFIKNLLNNINEKDRFIYRGNYVYDNYKEYVKTLERLGKYEDLQGNKVDILIVQLKTGTSLEHARTMQRNFISRYLNGGRDDSFKDAALVAFISPNQNDWRFSLVRMEYKLAKDGKVRQELTPARRYSFLVGENETSHTAQSRLAPIIEDDKNNPTLDQLEEAFNIEKVTKEFFEKYRGLFLKVKEELEKLIKKDKKIKRDFKDRNVNTVDFAKKTLGQIIFLYFLQKKGWFGVARDKDWGTGPKNFLRCLFDLPADLSSVTLMKEESSAQAGKQIADYKNFFNDILEPLFYEALARERDDNFYSRFNCKIPFLNGGLFDPLNDYDWVHTDILLPNKLFSNNDKTKEGDVGTGILDIFDRYNFTVKEDEPLEKEVAIDPEMLGKVFENLLEVKDRKSKGTYYTPREIVHYMCQQSLINYLVTESDLERKKIEALVKPKPLTKKDYQEFRRKGGKKNHVVEGAALVLWEKEARDLDKALRDIRICDPACGSGAFLVGMLKEVVRARKSLAFILDREVTEYELKRDTIQNCLYGVDIDLGAVEIAKLRLWLSLIVDEKDIKRIKPLPNLDYKIMQGNSLIELLSPDLVSKGSDEEKNKLIDRLNDLKSQYFESTDRKEKVSLRDQINNLIVTIVRYDKAKKLKEKEGILKALKSQEKLFTLPGDNLSFGDVRTNKKVEKLTKETKKLRKEISISPDHFEWHLNFNEVFEGRKRPARRSLEQSRKDEGGFDVMIANPPYIGFHGISGIRRDFVSRYNSAKGKFDLYIIFIEKSVKLTRDFGIITFICPTNFMKRKHGEMIRVWLLRNTDIIEIIDFEHSQKFESVTNYTGIFIWQKKVPFDGHKLQFKKDLFTQDIINYPQKDLCSKVWVIRNENVRKIVSKIEKNLRLWQVAKSISEGIVTGFNKYYLLSARKIKEEKFEKKYFRKCLRGKEVRRNLIIPDNYYVFYPYNVTLGKTRVISEKILKKNCVNYYKFLLKSKAEILDREYFIKSGKSWFELWNQRSLPIFTKEKILTPELSDGNNFVFDSGEYFYGDTVCGITLSNNPKIKLKTLLAILNSKLIDFYYKSTTVPKAGGFYIYKVMYLKDIPIAIPLERMDYYLLKKQEQLHKIMKSCPLSDRIKEYEKQIDQMVYKLYGLTGEEIRVVEEANKK